MSLPDLEDLPGHELVLRGVDDASNDRPTAAAALVFVASGRLRELGLRVHPPVTKTDWELVLYERLGALDPEGDTYATYGAWLEELDAFLEALEGRARRRADGMPLQRDG